MVAQEERTPLADRLLVTNALYRRAVGSTMLPLLLLRAPKETKRLMREQLNALLDARFALRARIPAPPRSIRTALGQYDLTLPPANALQSGGCQSIQGLQTLVALGKAIEAQTVFEFGTYAGATALTLAMNLTEATVHTLDLPPKAQPAKELYATDSVHFARTGARVYENRPEAVRIIQHLSDSARFDYAPFHEACDLIYIDGAHSYAYVRNDTEAALGMIKRDTGVIVWDDYWWQVSDVVRYLERHRRPNMYHIPGSRLVMWLSDGARGRLLAEH